MSRRRLALPRSLRARLTATYTLAAAVIAAVGAAVFLAVLRTGLQANLDDDVESRAATLGAVLQASVEPPDLPQPAAAPSGTDRADTFAAYRAPNGELISATGARLPPFSLRPGFGAGPVQGATRTSVIINRVVFRVIAVPVHRPEGLWLALAGASRNANDEAVGEVTHGLLVAGPGLVALVAAGTWLLAGAALRPVDRMRRDAAELGSRPGRGRLTEPDTGDELAALARTLNELLERLQQSLARQRDLVADAGHELRTPLAVLRTELELADRPGRSRAELAAAVSSAAVEADRLSQLADDLLFLARADEGEALVRLQPIDLCTILEEAARATRGRSTSHSVDVVVDVPDALPAMGDPSALRRAVDNVLVNALEHNRPGGTVRLFATSDPASGTIMIRIEDEGPGFPAEFLPHAFERFRRADPARRHSTGHAGTGLGLAIVAEVAAAHGGVARAANRPTGGASVELEVPGTPERQLAEQPRWPRS